MNLSFLLFLTDVILFLISSKKFQAKGTKVIDSSSEIVFNSSMDLIGICCLNGCLSFALIDLSNLVLLSIYFLPTHDS